MTKREHQLMLETLYSKNQLMKRVVEYFVQNLPQDMVDLIGELQLPEIPTISALGQIALHKRADIPTMVGMLRHHFDGDVQATADFLLTLCEHDFMDWHPVLKKFLVIYELDAETWEQLEMFQYPLPLIIEPQELKSNLDNPYLTIEKSSVILRDNHHYGDVCLDHLNRMNKIRLRINHDVVDTIHNKWRYLDSQKPGEDFTSFKQRQRSFEKYDRTARKVIDIVTEFGNEFYLHHKVDKRGRTYCQGYHINPQGNSWNKAAIEFATQEVTE